MEELIIQLISNVGFPIVAFLLMYRLTQTTIKDNTKAINNLAVKMELLHAKN